MKPGRPSKEVVEQRSDENDRERLNRKWREQEAELSTCHCKKPIKGRTYCGIDACALCGRFIRR